MSNCLASWMRDGLEPTRLAVTNGERVNSCANVLAEKYKPGPGQD